MADSVFSLSCDIDEQEYADIIKQLSCCDLTTDFFNWLDEYDIVRGYTISNFNKIGNIKEVCLSIVLINNSVINYTVQELKGHRSFELQFQNNRVSTSPLGNIEGDIEHLKKLIIPDHNK